MASKNELNSLAGKLAKTTVDGQSLSRLISPGSPKSGNLAGVSGFGRPGSSGDFRSVSIQASGRTTSGINFGPAPSNKTTASQSGSSEWTNLLKQTASGGLASAFGGGLLSAIGGLGGLVSSIAGLFGKSSKTPAPLAAFQLPGSVSQTFALPSSQIGSASGSASAGPVYKSIQDPVSSNSSATGAQSYQYQSAQIAEAVKQALLNSSSLSDVIAEI